MTTVDSFKLMKSLGEGAFSKVKLVKDSKGQKYAMKIMKIEKKDNEKREGYFQNEVEALETLDHPNILKMAGYSKKSEAIRPDGSKLKLCYINLEFCEGGELFDYVAQSGSFTESQARFYFHQLIDALDYMHKKGYKHRDVKLENILLDNDFNMKLADFGFATKEDVSYKRKGTIGYMAPEVLAHEPYKGAEADIFAAAVILFILVTKHPPFIRADSSDRYYNKIIMGNLGKFWAVHNDLDLSENFIDLISKMLNNEPEDRLTIEEIKAHPWYTGYAAKPEEIISEFTRRQKIVNRKLKEKAKAEKAEKVEKAEMAKRVDRLAVPERKMNTRVVSKSRKRIPTIQVSRNKSNDKPINKSAMVASAQLPRVSMCKLKQGFFRINMEKYRNGLK